MTDYESGDFEPPAPVVRVVVRGPRTSSYPHVPLLIDTGADVSVVPTAVAEAVGATISPSVFPIQFLDGEETFVEQAELTVEFLRYRFSGQFLVTTASYGVLGRNILNSLHMTLDGPSLRWSFL